MDRALLVLYINTKTRVQTWALYWGGHEEADGQLSLMLKTKDPLREQHRFWINAAFYDTGVDS